MMPHLYFINYDPLTISCGCSTCYIIIFSIENRSVTRRNERIFFSLLNGINNGQPTSICYFYSFVCVHCYCRCLPVFNTNSLFLFSIFLEANKLAREVYFNVCFYLKCISIINLKVKYLMLQNRCLSTSLVTI